MWNSLIRGEKVHTVHCKHFHTRAHAAVCRVMMHVCVPTVYPQRPGGPEHSPVWEQHCEDLWLWFGQRHIQRPRLRQERQCMTPPTPTHTHTHSLQHQLNSQIIIYLPQGVIKLSFLFFKPPKKWLHLTQRSFCLCHALSACCFDLLSGSPAFKVDGSREYLWQSVHQPEWCVVFRSPSLGNLFTR